MPPPAHCSCGHLYEPGGKHVKKRVRFRAALVGAILAGTLLSAAGATAASAALGHKSGGSLTVVTSAGPWVSLDPNNSVEPPGTANQFPWVESLFVPNAAGQPLHWLATSFVPSNGGLTVTIGVRKGITFQDGTPFNANAVAWNLQNYASLAVNSECTTFFTTLFKSVVAVSKYTVVLTLNTPDAGLQSDMTTLDCGDMLSPTAYAAEGAAGFANNPVGTGPFRYAGGTPTLTATFTRWKNYWGQKPKLNSITFQAQSNSTTALDELQNSSAQVWLNATQDQASVVKADRHLKIVTAPAASINYVTFSATHAPFNNPLAREAVMLATDSAAIRSQLYANFYPAVQGVIPPAMGAYYTKKVKGYPTFNLSAAQALVKQLGGLNFTLNVTNNSSFITEASALQAMWQQAGMTVTINPLLSASFLAALHAHTFQALLVSSIAYSDPDPLLYRFFYSGSALAQLGLTNGNTPVNAAADALILQGRRVYGVASRAKVYKQANVDIVSSYEWDDIYAATAINDELKSVKNFPASPYGRINWANVSL